MPYPTDLVRYIAVMRQGTIVEYGPPNPLFTSPTPPYTQNLLAAIPHLPKG